MMYAEVAFKTRPERSDQRSSEAPRTRPSGSASVGYGRMFVGGITDECIGSGIGPQSATTEETTVA